MNARMKAPETPETEAKRLAALQSLDLLDTVAEERFDRITRLARAVVDTPIALVSLVDADRQWFKSRQGLTAPQAPREISFCGHAILDNRVFWVEDAKRDERFHDNPLVVTSPHIRFYAGYPLHVAGGHRVGTLCAIGREPRPFDSSAVQLFADLGKLVENELAAPRPGAESEVASWSAEQRAPRIDGVTGAWNREGMLEVMEARLAACAEANVPATVFVGEIEGSSPMSESWVDEGKGILLAETAQMLRRSTRADDSLGRTGERQFALFVAGLPEEHAAARATYLCATLDTDPVLRSIGVRLRFAHACADPSSDLGAEALLESVEQRLQRLPAA